MIMDFIYFPLGLDIQEDVETAIQHIIADIIYTDSEVIAFIRNQLVQSWHQSIL